ncbi:peptidyl-tRNA hydrolase [Teratosphaeria nubilosa]|uniref:peptidyl-tRNA hydrolase n=1 Tax=Teratosphaeria nubilosa TaxID=161662 RepID=A0A6G1L3I4_9PEZI|nr:peptidyl-tRNA hydrolase [Teratosphaeria nubilosa]
MPAPAPARAIPLLICSIGNPGPTYAHTLHSAGHTVVSHLAAHLGSPPFTRDRALGNGLVSRPAPAGSSADWTLWQSTSYMNESGKGVKAAYGAWSRGRPAGEQGRLVVIYDELEQPLGQVTVRTASGLSARGHNGLKSIMAAMPQAPFARIGIGIGRPESRESNAVARYVLGKMRPAERERIGGSVAEVVQRLRQLERG